jgi:peroxiredoxin Q/BCP
VLAGAMHSDAVQHERETNIPFSHDFPERPYLRRNLRIMLKAGDKAPDFEVLDDQGRKFHLSDLKGKTVVLYFYPKADTPGCTKEACEFRDTATQYAKKNAAVIGVSPDEPSAQAKFKNKYELTFPLLADSDHKIAEAYGVWKEKSMYGKTYMGVERTTFVIGPERKILRVFEKVKPEGHADQVLAAL